MEEVNYYINCENYNLITFIPDTGNDNNKINIPNSRYLEGTDTFLINKYETNKQLATKLPCLFLPESKTKQNGFIGYIKNIEEENSNIKITPSIMIPDIKTSDILDNASDFNIQNNMELERTRWSIKNKNLLFTLNEKLPKIYKFDLKVKIFLSWSEGESREIAEAFKKILCDSLLLNDKQIFISSTSLEYGDDWWEQVKGALRDAELGLIFVTKGNVNRPWLNYEAGILLEQFKSQNKIIPISTQSDFDQIDSSPLLKFQFGKGIEHKETTKKILKKIAYSLNLHPQQIKHLEDNFAQCWDEFYEVVTNEPEYNYRNFRDMLRFWVPLVKQQWASKNGEYSTPFFEIIPEVTISDKIISNEKRAEQIMTEFDPSFLNFTSEDKICIKFSESGRTEYIIDSSITWIPHKEGQSWFIKIAYDHDKDSLKVGYFEKDGSKSIGFKELKEKFATPLDFKIPALKLGDFKVSYNVKALYEQFLQMIKYQSQFPRN